LYKVGNLCHAFGAHAVFPETRTVLDIGGRTQGDTGGQVRACNDFQMNDRCAAGCGRYLGYIADEMSISLNELGPLAMKAEKEVTICSTCTVLPGLSCGSLPIWAKKELISWRLHKAIIMRAMSLIARSGGFLTNLLYRRRGKKPGCY